MSCKKAIIFILILALSILPLGAVWASDNWGVQPEVLGDSDLDGSVTAADASLILRYLVRLTKVTSNYQFAHMDTDENGDITAADASHILRYIVKLGKLPFDPNNVVTLPPQTPTPIPSTSPRITPSPTPIIVTPSPTPKPYLETEAGLILHLDDPYFNRIFGFYSGISHTFTSAETSYTLKTNSTNSKDIIGWIYMQFYGKRIDGTYKTVTIDYPIMYRPELYYATHNENGESVVSGSICSLTNTLQVNNVVFGHNSRPNKWRFYDLHVLQNKINSEAVAGEAPSNYDFTISLYGYYNWRVWAMYETPTNEPESTQIRNTSYNCENNITSWINYQLSRSEVDFNVPVDNTDKFITLETCADVHYTNVESRLYIFLVRVD